MPFSSDESQTLQSQVTVCISPWLKNSTNNIVAALKLLK